MISLRVRLALVLVAAIVTVVVVAVFVTVTLVRGPRDGTMERAFAQNASTIAALVEGSAARARASGLRVEPAPEADRRERNLGRMRPGAEGASPPPREVVVVTGDGTSERHLAVQLTGDEWLSLPYPSQPPSPLIALSAYLFIVVMGTTAVALLVAARIMGPMRMLEAALSSVRADGTLAPIPERGSAEVQATARALNALSARLKAAMESRMRLVAAAGHDLRTPMTRLRLRVEFLPEGERETWLRDLGELDRIADSAIRLVREEVDDATFADTALAPLAATVATELAEIGLPAKFEGGGGDVAVRIQPLAMKRALGNLVENAARHGGGASVRIERRGDKAVVVIEDRGPGIPDALLDRVFEPFFRVDAARQKSHEGAGLGLAIAREIVERHGGSVSVRNRAGGGLRQEIELPVAAKA